jgi:anti-sigma regulatory factor (Ser/Thr protein kinase)
VSGSRRQTPAEAAAARTSWRQVAQVPDVAPAESIELTSLRELREVRRRVRAVLAASLDDDDALDEVAREDVVERVVLVIDELASNAVRHGAPPATLEVRETGEHWVVVVTDAAPDALPAPAVDRPAGQGGYGLYVIADLATAHGVEVHGDRKRVWARLAKPGPRRTSD